MAPKMSKKEAKAAKADKPKVKRAPSPYIIFCSEKRPEIKISHPDASFGETGKILGQMWAAVDEKAKAVSSCLTVRLLPSPFTLHNPPSPAPSSLYKIYYRNT
jgi:hypothetical protein